MKAVEMSIADIHPYQYNPRNNEGAVDVVADSIKEFGWKQPILVDENMTIINGHTRFMAAKKLGMTKVPVVIANGLAPDKVRRLRLVDNKVAEISSWDWEVLQEELSGLDEKEMSRFGFQKVADVDLTPKDMKPKKEKQSGPKECTCPRCGKEFEV